VFLRRAASWADCVIQINSEEGHFTRQDGDVHLMEEVRRPRDVTNRQLARNQVELHQQIAELRSAINAQRSLIEKLIICFEDAQGQSERVSFGDRS
jgi:hypothetical protein